MDASLAAVVLLACPGCESMSMMCLGTPLLIVALAVALVTPVRTEGVVRWGSRCTGCGYDLRGLGTKASCPECGQLDAGRVVSRPSGGLELAPVRVLLCFTLAACVVPVTALNFSGPVWRLLYLIEWGRVPVNIRPASGGSAVLLVVILMPLLARSLRPQRERGLGLTVLLSAAGFWLAQPLGVLTDWRLNAIQPGGPGMPIASAGGLLVGFAIARVVTGRRAMLRLRRIRRSRDERSNSPAAPRSPASSPGVRPITPLPGV